MKLHIEIAKLIDKWLPAKLFTEHERILANQNVFALCEQYANQSKWISVEERLPPKLNSHSSLLTEDVLAFDKTTETYLIAWYSFKSGKWHCEEDIILNITYWQTFQQLPEKP